MNEIKTPVSEEQQPVVPGGELSPPPLGVPAVESAAEVAPVPSAPAPVDDAPREFPLHPNHHMLWRWQSILTGIICGLPGLVALSVLFGWKGSLVAVLFGFLVARLMLAYGRAHVRYFRCALLNDGLLIEEGIWWRRQTFVPRARVQHTDVDQGPLQRRYGIATLKVFTAGTHDVKLEVQGISREGALALRDALLGRHDHDGV